MNPQPGIIDTWEFGRTNTAIVWAVTQDGSDWPLYLSWPRLRTILSTTPNLHGKLCLLEDHSTLTLID